MFTSPQSLSLKALGKDLTWASQAITRLDDALGSHPLQDAALYRLRLEAVRQMASVDGAVLDQGQARMPMRAALGRFWVARGVMRVPLPLTAAAALRAETSFERNVWVGAFLQAVTQEANQSLDRLRALERQWRHARAVAVGQRRNSRAQDAIDVLAAQPVTTAASLATSLSMSPTAAHGLLNRFVEDGLVQEMTGRDAWRLYTLNGDL